MSNFEAGDEVTDREFLEWSGSVNITIESGCLKDQKQNTNKKTVLGIGIVDFIRPEFAQIDLTSEDIIMDKLNRTQTIKIKVYDKFIDNPTEEEIENVKNNIIVYIDSEENTKLTKQLEYVDGRYILKLSNFKDGGEVKLRIPENVLYDQYGNGNKETFMEIVVDNTPPEITYEYTLDKIVDKVTIGAIAEELSSKVGINSYEQEKSASYRDVKFEGRSITVSIPVTSEDGKEKVIYQILVNKDSDVTATTNKKDMIIYGGIVVGVILIFVIIIIVVKSRKKKKQPTNNDNVDDYSDLYGYSSKNVTSVRNENQNNNQNDMQSNNQYKEINQLQENTNDHQTNRKIHT